MGLDMYLYKRSYVKDSEFSKSRYNTTVKLNGKVREDIKPERVSYVIEEVGYWRKFNALHAYIVNRHADGIDECQEIELDTSDLEVIIEMMEIIKSSGYDKETAKRLLPPQSGFFFGSQEIDEWYQQDVDNTIEIIGQLLQEDSTLKDVWPPHYYYQASW